MIEKKLIILSVLPFLLIIVFIIGASIIDLSPALTEEEQEALDFTYKGGRTAGKEALVVKNHLKSPVEIPKTLSPPLPPADTEPGRGISLIMIRGEEKIAIIDGKVAREGDTIDRMKILKIEKDKILIKSKEIKWLSMEGTK